MLGTGSERTFRAKNIPSGYMCVGTRDWRPPNDNFFKNNKKINGGMEGVTHFKEDENIIDFLKYLQRKRNKELN